MQVWLRYIICFCYFSALVYGVRGQDSTRKKSRISSLARDLYHSLMVTETKAQDSTFFQRSEAGFQSFTGKVIRNIIIHNLSFGENVDDTSSSIIGTLARMADRLQTNTKDWAIRELLFVKKGQLVNPYQLADNERYLRDQNFIKDARIVVRLVTADSVDLHIRLRDVFSWGAEIQTSGLNDFKASVYDANFLGMGQRLQYTMLYDHNRHPLIGSQVLYRKTSIGRSFINVTASYTNINTGAFPGSENESSWDFKLERPLYSPNAHVAGGLEVSTNRSINVFNKPLPQFSNYKYRLGDVWLGYNIGVYKQQAQGEDSRRRRFVSLRYFNQHFMQPPKLDTFDPRFANKKYILAQFNWYMINFYRTNYIYGFGRTEDIPVGMMRKVTIGPSTVDSLRRLYIGWEFDHWLVDKYDNYWNYTLALGANLYKKQWQDNTALLDLSWFSRLFEKPRFKFRQFANVSYAGIYKRVVNEPLYVNNELGLSGFNTDSVRANHRISLGTETNLYTKWSILGFKIGFLGFAKATLMAPQQTGMYQGGLFPALGAGIRTRNENLIFGTIEARFTWFPRTLYNVNNITLTVGSNLRVKFSGSFVQAPSFAPVR